MSPDASVCRLPVSHLLSWRLRAVTVLAKLPNQPKIAVFSTVSPSLSPPNAYGGEQRVVAEPLPPDAVSSTSRLAPMHVMDGRLVTLKREQK